MPEQPDLMALGREAMHEAKRLLVESVREFRKDVNGPAAGRERTFEERRVNDEPFVASPDQMELSWQMQEAQYNIPAGTMPRRWLERGVLIMKDRKQEATDA